MNIEQQLAEIMSLLFQKEIKPEDNFSKETEALWDSLKHIEIIMTVEEEFDISINQEDIPNLTSFYSITTKIKELKNENN